MKILENVLVALRSQWSRSRKSPVRQLKSMPRLEPLEVRTLLAGEFTDLGALGITGVIRSSVAWGDADNDGDLDILLTGIDTTNTSLSEVYQNNGDGTFTDLNAGLVAVLNGSVAWGDADNDGDLDILLTGRGNGNEIHTEVYRNDGNSTFTDLNVGLTGVQYSSVALGDADNDGDLDILITGTDIAGISRIAKVYRNDGGGLFTDLNAALTGVANGSVAWGDADNDGDLDILLSGRDSANIRIAKVYLNNGNSTFTDLNAGLSGVDYSSVAWGDADSDGDLDILLTGQDNGFIPISKVYLNNGDSTFTDLNAGLTGVVGSSVAWGDYDNDGHLDILLTGRDNTNTRVAKVYRNNGNSTFTDLSAGLTGVVLGSVAWGDYDNDGDLDIILTGYDNTSARITRVFRNNAATANTAPAAPSALTATVPTDTSLTFQWTAPADAQTSAAGLSYNLRVGTTPGASDVFSTMASTTNGTRRLPAAGPIQGTSFTLEGLTFGETYYWSVQAIDTARAGSPFAPEQAAAVNNAPVIGGAVANQPVNDTATISPFATLTVTDPDAQAMSATVTVLNGVVRGDFTAASAVGWTRAVIGNNIRYSRYYGPQANLDSVMQAAIREFVFQPRSDAINPNTTELTDFSIFITDGVASTTNTTTRVVTTSVNDAPTVGGAVANQPVNDTATVTPFTTFTVIDPDTQAMTASVTILNGVVRGDFTGATTTGWTRTVIGNNIRYNRTYSPAANIGATVQAAIQAFVFQPRAHAIKPNTTETTVFSITVTDGVASPVSNSTTSVITTSVNDAPVIGGASPSVAVNDNATVNPLSTLTVTDADLQEMLISVTILNGKFRGDFTTASTADWPVRYTTGNDITYKRYFGPQANVGAAAQAAFRALVFQPRSNAINPGTTELTDFQVTVSDGVAPAVLGTGTRVTTTSINNAPTIGGAVAGQTMNDNQTKAVFSTLTVTDPDTQGILARVTITNGTTRGDFTSASAVGWTRSVSGTNIIYNRYFNPAANNGAIVQTAVRALVFQPRNNVPLGTTETTSFTVFVNDGLANITNSTTSVITTGVAPRQAASIAMTPPLFLESDIATVVVPSNIKSKPASLAKLLRKTR